ncbi:hypothetical protein BFP70_12010 [Thioclava sp. SK-1]|uniref:TniQ family protein n=1 Tax=Thioclava sp. SK-1 TaxID=1889770 RepID=UPI0008266547|nr:TniQ family protein [Thioclava sp. SK-1]OCX63724.1 hypothetical protein BFP70_12010 [Thioclava sp. SK-1]
MRAAIPDSSSLAMPRLVMPLGAVEAEPAFSVLSRNAFANAFLSTAEFCTATGLRKAAVCAGDPQHLHALAALTGSRASDLIAHSPCKLSEKHTDLQGLRFLTRSIRKHDLAICPTCWLESVEKGGGSPDALAMQWRWLPRFITSCSLHGAALVELPYADYTTCYDQVLRAKLEPGWIASLEAKVTARAPTDFEMAAMKQFTEGVSAAPNVPGTQLDILERWCLGLGALITKGTLRPDSCTSDHKREFLDVGFSVTRDGKGKIFDEVDRALGKHKIRLSKSWVHGWSLQAVAATERAEFRSIMLDLVKNQGHYGLHHRPRYSCPETQLSAHIKKIAVRTKRSERWVRKVLKVDGFLPLDPDKTSEQVRTHLYACGRHVRAIADSWGVERSAEYLGISTDRLKRLVAERKIRTIKTNYCKTLRFRKADLDGFADAIMPTLD